MELQKKTLEKLRDLINEETEYRSGPKLVSFFNELGFSDSYGQGFPSRWMYTDDKLKKINGTPELDECIRNLFAPVNYIGKISKLDEFINEFNQYLSFDKWKIIRNETEIFFKQTEKVILDDNETESKDDFLSKDFSSISIDDLGLDLEITSILKSRVDEIQNCLDSNAPLSVIVMIGSTLEGILLGIARKFPQQFNQSETAPKNKENKPKKFDEWTLKNFIDVACSLNLLQEDIRKFSHLLREFRNYIHPYEQLKLKFQPSQHTEKICWQVLQAAIYQLSESKNIIKPNSDFVD